MFEESTTFLQFRYNRFITDESRSCNLFQNFAFSQNFTTLPIL